MTLRGHVESLNPRSYLGVDIVHGRGVDEIASVYELVDRFGVGAFDLVVSTELVEHVRDWRSVFRNLKAVVREGGVLLLTTRSPGFAYHGWPQDYWRYTQRDMHAIFADMEIEALEDDPSSPGVFVKARKPQEFVEADLTNIDLFSIIGRKPRRRAPSRVYAAIYVGALRAYRRAQRR